MRQQNIAVDKARAFGCHVGYDAKANVIENGFLLVNVDIGAFELVQPIALAEFVQVMITAGNQQRLAKAMRKVAPPVPALPREVYWGLWADAIAWTLARGTPLRLAT